MCLLPSLKRSSIVSSLGIVQWDFTRRDHPGNPGRVSGSGPVKGSQATKGVFTRQGDFVDSSLWKILILGKAFGKLCLKEGIE